MAETIDKKELQAAIALVVDCIEPSDASAPSTYTIFQRGRVHGFNDISGVSVPLSVVLPDCAVETKLLYDFVKKMPDEQLIVGLSNGNLKIVGASKNISAEFAIRQDLIYPEEWIVTDPSSLVMLPEAFQAALVSVAPACSEDKPQYRNAIFKDGKAYGVSPDYIALFDLNDPELFKDMLFISPKATRFVNKYLPKRYSSNDGLIHLVSESMQVYTTRTRSDIAESINLGFLDAYFSSPELSTFHFPTSMDKVLDRCNPFSGKSAKAKRLSFSLHDGMMEVAAVREDGSKIKERCLGIECTNPVTFTTGFKLLSTALPLTTDCSVCDGMLLLRGTQFTGIIPLTEEA